MLTTGILQNLAIQLKIENYLTKVMFELANAYIRMQCKQEFSPFGKFMQGKFSLGFNPSILRVLVPGASLLGSFLSMLAQNWDLIFNGFLGNSVFSFKVHCKIS